MGRFSGAASVRAAQEGKLADLDLPVGETEAEAAPSQQSALLRRMQEQQEGGQPPAQQQVQPEPTELAPEEQQQAVQAGTDQLVDTQLEGEDRFAVGGLRERFSNPQAPKWSPSATQTKPIDFDNSPDGGIFNRAKGLAAAVETGGLNVAISAAGTPGFAVEKAGGSQFEVAEAIQEADDASLYAALGKVNALAQNQRGRQSVDPEFALTASMVIENEIANTLFGTDEKPTVDSVEAATEADVLGSQGQPKKQAEQITLAQGNAKIGNQILLEYQRLKGNQSPEKAQNRREAEVLGATFKELWARNNPDLVNSIIDPKTGQKVYKPTPLGERALQDGTGTRKKLFPTVNVKPAKQPLQDSRLPGDVGQNVVKRASGKLQGQKFGKEIPSAIHNLGQVPNVVDKQRAKILFTTALPIFANGNHNSWQADINNIGQGKINKFVAAQKQYQKEREAAQLEGKPFNKPEYSPEENLASIMNDLAQEIRAVATERNGANYLSYNVQGFQGRITPQQSHFNPTRSKAVRFVTRNAVPAVTRKRGDRVDQNLRQMYTMMLLPKNVKGDLALPAERESLLRQHTPRVVQWGKRLKELVDNTMTDAQYETVAAAVEQGLPLSDPIFQQNLAPLELDPEADKELIAHIKSKGEDGPHTIDGLIDFYNYHLATTQGKPYASYFNAYMDGKTNGLASNGMQMGNIPTAARTGVLRDSKETLLDDGDIRDELQKLALESVRENGFGGNMGELEGAFVTIAEKAFSHRDFNKMTTMTFGYGKEIDSFKHTLNDTLAELKETAGEADPFVEAMNQAEQQMSSLEIAEVLMEQHYANALAQVVSPEAIESRALMRSVSALYATMNEIMSFQGPSGMDLMFGKDISTGEAGAQRREVGIYEGDQKAGSLSVASYDNEATSAAPRTQIDPDTGEEVQVAGEHAYGGSVVGPVQALDAATVARTASGKSWDKLKRASGGNPLHAYNL